MSVVARNCMGELAYLATPYTKLAANSERFSELASERCSIHAAVWAAALAVEGVTAVSPIVQAHEMVMSGLVGDQMDPLDAAFWERWCRPLLTASGVVIIPPIKGWQDSAGIWAEVCQALKLQKRVFVIGGEMA